MTIRFDQQVIGEGSANLSEEGGYAVPVTIPADAMPGTTHTITATCTAPDGSADLTQSQYVTVVH